ncbi:hypothetical protein SAMN04487992_106118 [Cellulophaga baltica]|uniref:Uncharacterized protein n=1 Tax=Cellulophaga baltica TaxID=76594 RepID=A0A1G7HK11_9FLAO|nr:hypothetical protein SAMN04487992_106118 [Cellulophaga baltica]
MVVKIILIDIFLLDIALITNERYRGKFKVVYRYYIIHADIIW